MRIPPICVKLTVVVCVALSAAACTTPQQKNAAAGQAEADALLAKSATVRAAVGAGSSQHIPATPSYIETAAAFVTRGKTGQSQRIREERALPAIFEEPFSLLMGTQAVPLSRVAREIEQELRLPVRILPDVFENPNQAVATGSAASPSSSVASSTGAPSPAVVSGAPGLVLPSAPMPTTAGALGAGVPQVNGQPVAYMPMLEINISGSRREVLNAIAAKAGVEWDYMDGEIQFSRLISRTFTLDSSPRVVESEDNLTASGGASGGAGSSTTESNSTDEVTVKAKIDAMSDLEQQLLAIRSPRGRIILSPSNNTVLVRDTRAVVDQAASLIDRYNAIVNRQVVIDLEIISVTSSSETAYGFDLSLVLQRMTAAGADATLFKVIPVAPLAGDTAPGLIQFTMQNQSAKLNGSQVLLRALSAFGNARTIHRGSKMTRNNLPAGFQNLRDTSYVATITPAPAGAGGVSGGTPGIQQATVTTGFLAKIYPSVLSGNRVLLDGLISLSNLDRLVSASSGGNTVQSPDVSRVNAPLHTTVRSGDYIAFQAFERDVSSGDRIGFEPTGILGFSAAGTRTLERFIVVMRTTILSAQ